MTHDLWVGLGVLTAGLVLAVDKRRRRVQDERVWVLIITGYTLFRFRALPPAFAESAPPLQGVASVEAVLANVDAPTLACGQPA